MLYSGPLRLELQFNPCKSVKASASTGTPFIIDGYLRSSATRLGIDQKLRRERPGHCSCLLQLYLQQRQHHLWRQQHWKAIWWVPPCGAVNSDSWACQLVLTIEFQLGEKEMCAATQRTFLWSTPASHHHNWTSKVAVWEIYFWHFFLWQNAFFWWEEEICQTNFQYLQNWVSWEFSDTPNLATFPFGSVTYLFGM